MYNFGELKTQTGYIVQRSDDPSYLNDEAAVFLNLAQDFLFNSYDYFTELQDVYNFTTVDGTENYVMPAHFDKPLRVYDLTNNKKISPETEEEYFDGNIQNIADSVTGKPENFRLFGVKGITGTIGATGTTLKAKSSSASDTDNPVIRVEGYIDSSKTILDYEEITISASGPTGWASGTKTFYGITHVSKSQDTTGYLTLADSSNTTLAILASKTRVLRHKVMKLGLIPDGAYSMRTLFKKKKNKLNDDEDYPFIEADNFLVLEAAGYCFAQDRDSQRASDMWRKSKDALYNLLTNQNAKLGPDYQHKLTTMFAQAHRM